MELQELFYIIGIVYMVLMTILAIAVVVAVFVIRAKINHIHEMIEEKINTATNIAEKSGEWAGIVGATLFGTIKNFLNKKK